MKDPKPETPPDEAAAPAKPIHFNVFLPYWAVFQADMEQTLRSWLYRFWVVASILVSLGYLLYRFGAYREAGMMQHAGEMMADIFRWFVLGSITLIIVLVTGCISSERGTMADSVLSRGISRHQYFLGKWHARLVSVLGTFLALSVVLLLASSFLLRDERFTLTGSAVALGTVAAFLILVITFGVTVSAMTNSTLLAVALVWMVMYGSGFALSLLPASYPSPDRALRQLPQVMHGLYDLSSSLRLIGYTLAAALGLALLGMVSFSRRDV